jgi:hypothetical protein
MSLPPDWPSSLWNALSLLEAKTARFPKRFIMHIHYCFLFAGKVLPGVAALSDATKG